MIALEPTGKRLYQLYVQLRPQFLDATQEFPAWEELRPELRTLYRHVAASLFTELLQGQIGQIEQQLQVDFEQVLHRDPQALDVGP